MTKIATLREHKKITQSELADAVGVSRSAVAMWETGEAFPRADKLPKLAETLGCEIKDLY